jgi:hypothetical protein
VKIYSKIVNFLDGKKTYIGGAIIFIAGGLKAIKVIDQGVFEAMIAIGGAISAFGIRSAIRKICE